MLTESASMPISATAVAPEGSDTPRRRPSPFSLAAWKQFVAVAKPYWQGDQKKAAWTLLALLVMLMLAETQFAVMLNTQSGEMASALAGQQADRFWNSVYACLGCADGLAPGRCACSS